MGIALLLFSIEVFLALYVRDDFFRPIFGDLLVVILLYTSIRSFWLNKSLKLVLAICFFAYGVEIIQLWDPVARFGWQDNRFLSIVIGRVFAWEDLLAYSVGSLINYRLREL